MRVKMVVAYDGTNYSGWQIQPSTMGPSIQPSSARGTKRVNAPQLKLKDGPAASIPGLISAFAPAVTLSPTLYGYPYAGGEDQLRIKPEAAGRYRGAGFLRSAGYLSSTFFQKPKDL